MAQESYPRPGYNAGALSVTEYDALMRAYTATGLVGLPTDPAIVAADSSGYNVKIPAGKFMYMRGRLWTSGGAAVTFNPTANPGAARVDTVMGRLTKSTGVVDAYLKAGTSGVAAGPAPLVADGDATFEWPMADVRIPAGATNATILGPTDVTLRGYYLGEFGGYYVCTSATRPAVKPGLRIHEVDTGKGQIGVGSSWRVIYEDTGWVDVTPAAGWARSILRYRRKDGLVHIRCSLQRTGTALAVGSDSPLCTFPAVAKPDNAYEERILGTAWLGSGPINVFIRLNPSTGALVLTDFYTAIGVNYYLHMQPTVYVGV